MSKSSKKKKSDPRSDGRANRSGAAAKEFMSEVRPVEASSLRETIESVVIAFVLAFLFRTFAAEAFVIPTGSMAHTLRGAHKDVDCPECGYRYQFGASSEYQNSDESSPTSARDRDVVSGTCPICRFTLITDPRPDPELQAQSEYQRGLQYSTYNGDRIIVSKFDYVLHEPGRWDVIVFKFPGGANTNYIKRLIGLPGETVGIWNGDIYIGRDDKPLAIESKPPNKVLAMRQLVSDSHRQPKKLTDAGWPYRWQVWNSGEGDKEKETSWTTQLAEDELNRWQEFSIDSTQSDPSSSDAQWIRYQHVVPDFGDWRHVIEKGDFKPSYLEGLSPQLITDFYGYNTSVLRRQAVDIKGKPMGIHWVGDLSLECDVTIQSENGTLLLDLVEAGRHFTASIDIATGKVTLTADGDDEFNPQGQTAIKGTGKGMGKHQINFANVDDRLLLWIDGGLVAFDQDTKYDATKVFGKTYRETKNTAPKSNGRDGDLSPVGVGSRGAKLKVTGLRVYRDLHYIADKFRRSNRPHFNDPQQISEYVVGQLPWNEDSPEDPAAFLSDYKNWDVFTTRNREEFPQLEQDQFFVLGDNSPSSSDARLWTGKTNGKHYVERKLLIGKALFIYWPHSWGEWPVASRFLPGWPAFGDMKLVR